MIWPLSHGYTCNFLLTMAMQFQEITALPSRVPISICAGNATTSEKLQKTESRECTGNFSVGKFFQRTV